MPQGPIHFRGVNWCSVYLKTESVILTRTKSVITTSGNNIYLGKSVTPFCAWYFQLEVPYRSWSSGTSSTKTNIYRCIKLSIPWNMRTTYVNTTALTAVGIQSAYSEVRHDPKKSWDLPRIMVRSQCHSSQHLSHVVGWVIHTSVGIWLHTQCIMLSSFHSPLVCSQFKMSNAKVYPGFRLIHVYLSVNLVVSFFFVLSHHSVSSKICING